MTEFAHAYVHRDSVGSRAACDEVVRRAESLVDRWYQAAQIEGYQLIVVEDAEVADAELVLVRHVQSVAGGRFPYVYARVQPVDGKPVDVDGPLERLGYVRVDQLTPPVG